MEKLCRICWNTNKWKTPSGDARKYEAPGSYVTEYGFGHEEWLFNFQWLLPEYQGNSNNKYHYGFLQPFNKLGEKFIGKYYTVTLYSVSPDKEFLLVAKINNIFMPEVDELEWAHQKIISNGWLNQMREDLKSLGINSSPLNTENARDLINVKFRQDDVELFETRLKVTDYFKRKNMLRYHPYNVKHEFSHQITPLQSSPTTSVESEYSGPIFRSEAARTRASIEGVNYDPRHYILEKPLYNWLSDKFGEENIKYEHNFVDLTLHLKGKTTFYEIKMENTVKRCIRLAIGQLLEYSHYPDQIRADKLIVVGEGKVNEEDKLYLNNIRTLYNMPIYYARWNWENEELEEEI